MAGRPMPHVRLARPEDAQAVADLLCAFRDWWGYNRPSDAEMLAGVERLSADPDTDYLLGATELGAAPAGVCQLRYRFAVWHGAEDCWLEDLYVRDDARRSGLGRALGEAALRRARERGCARVQLDVNGANPAARALYERLGFSSWADPPGGDTLLMQLALSG